MEENLFTIKRLSKEKGCGVVAAQDLLPGQVILVEEAGIIGPASADSCLECLDLTQGKKTAGNAVENHH